ncbi:hypothetical protein JavanS395_0012 [Streptococcus satellite phage Javan395]|nr:hypothetical protein JavanS395_0012 [Streptococcus satellite phage Javan395]
MQPYQLAHVLPRDRVTSFPLYLIIRSMASLLSIYGAYLDSW